MPELPDIEIYAEKLESFIVGQVLERIRLRSAFVLRSVEPPISSVDHKRVEGIRRIGKQLVISLEQDLHLVIHLMIAGRLRWRTHGAALSNRVGLAAFDFENGTLLFTETGKRKRASLHLVAGEAPLRPFDRGGPDPQLLDEAQFHAALTRENHTLKRALTDQRIVSGIGNAYSDEILHHAAMSPTKRTASLSQAESGRLLAATKAVLADWTERLRGQCGNEFPDKVTAFHPEMAVHGRYGHPCPRCGSPVQRIVYAANESNYCAQCQTAGKILADRALSRLLKKNWPKSLEELESL